MVKLNLFGPQKGKDKDFWDRYEEEIGEYDIDSDEDLNDGDWEEFED